MTTITRQPVTGQDINLAARAVRTVLDAFLAERGLSFPPLAALNAIDARGPAVPRADLERALAVGLAVDQSIARALLRHLETEGLIRPSSFAGVEFTAVGAAEHRRLRLLIAPLIAELYVDFDPDELDTTRRILVTLTERANVRLRPSLT